MKNIMIQQDSNAELIHLLSEVFKCRYAVSELESRTPAAARGAPPEVWRKILQKNQSLVQAVTHIRGILGKTT